MIIAYYSQESEWRWMKYDQGICSWFTGESEWTMIVRRASWTLWTWSDGHLIWSRLEHTADAVTYLENICCGKLKHRWYAWRTGNAHRQSFHTTPRSPLTSTIDLKFTSEPTKSTTFCNISITSSGYAYYANILFLKWRGKQRSWKTKECVEGRKVTINTYVLNKWHPNASLRTHATTRPSRLVVLPGRKFE